MSTHYVIIIVAVLFTACNRAVSQPSIDQRLNGDFEQWLQIAGVNSETLLIDPDFRGSLKGWFPERGVFGTGALSAGSKAAVLTDLYGNGKDRLATFPVGADPFELGIALGTTTLVNFSLDYKFLTGDELAYATLGGKAIVLVYRQNEEGGVDTVGTGTAYLEGEPMTVRNTIVPIQYQDDTDLLDLYASVEITLEATGVERKLDCLNCINLVVDNLRFNVEETTTSRIASEDYHSNLDIYPNPVRDLLTIISPSEYREKIMLVHESGQLLRKFTIPAGREFEISVRDLPPGLIYAIDDKGTLIKKLLKK